MSDPQQRPRPYPGVFFSMSEDESALAGQIDSQEYRTRLEALVSGRNQETSDVLQALLELGTEWFEVEVGGLARIDPAEGTHTVVEQNGSRPIAEEEAGGPLSSTYCRAVLAEGEVLAVDDAPEQGWAGDQAYEKFGFSTYFGAKVVVGGDLFGTVYFGDEAPRGEPFRESEAAALALNCARGGAGAGGGSTPRASRAGPRSLRGTLSGLSRHDSRP